MQLVALAFLLVFGSSVQANSLNVSLFYEALCPDSVRFITQQLYPSYHQISDYLNVQFVPWGFTNLSTSNVTLNFTCQHGPNECYSNKIQSCIIFKTDPESTIEFVNCAEQSSDPSNDKFLRECAKSSDISWNTIEECINSGEGDILYIDNGIRTAIFVPNIQYVPSIVFNGVYNETLQSLGERHFLDTACLLLGQEPSVCG